MGFALRAALESLASRGESGIQPKVAINGAWSVVHGLSMLLIDGKIKPGELGNPKEDELIESVLEIWARGIEQGLCGWTPSQDG
jgi:hypothetical protein